MTNGRDAEPPFDDPYGIFDPAIGAPPGMPRSPKGVGFSFPGAFSFFDDEDFDRHGSTEEEALMRAATDPENGGAETA